MKEAVLVIDMIYDFVYGKLGSEGAKDIVKDLKTFLQDAKKTDRPILFVQDQHESWDPELNVWDKHAMKGEKGAETIDELKGLSDRKVRKNNYDGFYGTELHELLQENSIEQLVLTGVTTDICVQHTAAGAFFRNYEIKVLKDCTSALSKKRHENALKYMENIYGAEKLTSKELIDDQTN